MALREGSLIVNSSQGGGSKDTWIVDADDDFSARFTTPQTFSQLVGGQSQCQSQRQSASDGTQSQQQAQTQVDGTG